MGGLFGGGAGLGGAGFGGGLGGAGFGAPCGGVSIVVREALHRVYRRVGDDLLAVVAVPLLLALTGGRMRMQRLDGGALDIALPEDSVAQPGEP
jgi:DnaJ-class molecular chaperone